MSVWQPVAADASDPPACPGMGPTAGVTFPHAHDPGNTRISGPEIVLIRTAGEWAGRSNTTMFLSVDSIAPRIRYP
jgi:hypothetical protein